VSMIGPEVSTSSDAGSLSGDVELGASATSTSGAAAALSAYAQGSGLPGPAPAPMPALQVGGGYITLPIAVDPSMILAQALDCLAAQFPGWVPREGHLEVALLEAMARMVSQSAAVAAQVPLAIFQYFGTSLLQLPPGAGAGALMATTWTMVDAQGYTIPAGTLVAYPASGSNNVLFVVPNAFSIPPGAQSSGPGAVLLQALQPGSAANALAPKPCVLVDSLACVATVTSTAPTSGGADAESLSAYLNRLSTELQLIGPRPILTPDFAALALNQAGVGRACAINGFNPTDGSTNNERMVAVALVDANGDALASTTLAAVQAYLESVRELNFVVNVFAPTYSAVSITAQLVAAPGQSVAGVQQAAVNAAANALSPANWGGGNLSPPQWNNETTLRYLELVALLGNVAGVDYVASLTTGIGANPTMGTVDLTLPGTVALPRPGNIAINVVAGT
jgi:hypothetical protein